MFVVLAQIPASSALRSTPIERVAFPSFVERRAELDVTVTGDSGAPVPNATVRVFWYDGGRYYFAGAALADALGRAALEDLPRGPAWLLVDASGWGRRSLPVLLAAAPKDGSVARVGMRLERSRALHVHVEDDEHAAVASATVLISGGDPLPFGALTGEDGNVVEERLGAGPLTVRAAARGYDEETRTDVVADATLTLRRASGIDVTVVDAASNKGTKATILVAGSGLWPARSVVTDDGGHVRVMGLGAGAYDLRAQAGALVSRTEVGVKVERGAVLPVSLLLVPGRMIPILVTDGDGDHPVLVPDADVLVVEGGVSSFPLQGRTDRFGKVLLGPVAPGAVMAAARAEGFVSRSTVAVPDVIAGDVRIALLRGATLKGTVVDAEDRAVEGASIEVVGTDVDGMPVALTPLSTDFQRAHFEWALAGPAPLIPAGELGVLAGPIPPIPNGPGGAMAPSFPSLPAVETTASSAAWVTNSSGSFHATPIPPGRVRALVRHPDYVEATSEMVTTSPGGVTEVRIVLGSGGAIDGHVVDERGISVARSRVHVSAAQGTLDRTTTSADDGSFSFAALPDDAVLAVSRPEDPYREIVRRVIHVVAGKTTEISLTLPAVRDAIRVSVSDDSNRPVKAAQISALSLDPEKPLRATAFSDDTGAVSFDDATGLPLRLIVESPGFSRWTRQYDAAPAAVDVVLGVSVTVEGHVTTVRGRQDLDGASVEMLADGHRRVALTDALGHYTFAGVSPGPIHVGVSHPDYAPGSFDAVVESTGRADRSFDLPDLDMLEPAIIEGRVVDASGNGVPSARVGVGVLPAFVPVGAVLPAYATTQSDGTFRLERVRPGKIDVEAAAPGLGRGRRVGLDVEGGRTTSDVVVQLDPSADSIDPTATGGVAVTLSSSKDGQALVVQQVSPGSEAERGGLLVGDGLLSVDRAALHSTADAIRKLAGPDGSDVVVEVQRGPSRLSLRVRRERVRR
jgi:protocatechuate 3,4-dioxygenase beta subunit